MICCSASQALQPLRLQKRLSRPTCSPSSATRPSRRLIGPVSQPIGLQSVFVVRADAGREGPLAEPEEPHNTHEGLTTSAKQLLSVTALAFFTVSGLLVYCTWTNQQLAFSTACMCLMPDIRIGVQKHLSAHLLAAAAGGHCCKRPCDQPHHPSLDPPPGPWCIRD